MVYFRVFQVLLLAALVFNTILDARAMIVEDRSLSPWSFVLPMAVFTCIYIERYIQRRRRKA